MELLVIGLKEDKSNPLYSHPDCQQLLGVYETYYPKVGFHIPWVGYFVVRDNKIVGTCGFVKAPEDGVVEIAYWTFKECERQGVASFACKELISIARNTDIGIVISAKTTPQHNSSTRILQANGFVLAGSVTDHEIGNAWLWLLPPMDRNKSAVDVFNKHAEGYASRFMDVSLYSESLDLFCKSVTQSNAEILEIACGPGNITKYLLSQRPDFKILGTDLSPNMLKIARENNPTATFEVLDGRKIRNLKKRYDGIVCGFCFPYFTKEEAIQFINDSGSLLNTNGILYLSTMEDDYSKSRLQKGSTGDEIYMHYHEANYLLDALANNNFNIVNIDRKVTLNTIGQKDLDLIIIAKLKDTNGED